MRKSSKQFYESKVFIHCYFSNFHNFTGCSNDDSRADLNASTVALSTEAKAQIAAASDIYQLTNEDVVVDYVKNNKNYQTIMLPKV